jgi:predicted amidohydrolase YtcJ
VTRPLLALLMMGSVAMAEPADLILRHGEILTLDPAHPRAESLATHGGRIVALGPDAEVARLIGPRTRVVELDGRAVAAALTDGHAHLSGLGLAMARADLRGCPSPEACAEKAKSVAGAWALGRGWDQNRFADRTFPTHEALDRVLGERPAWLTRIDGHAGWANQAALSRAGVTAATPDPPGGRIVRDARGNPTGVFVDGAMGLVTRAIPAPTADELERSILRAQDAVLAEGLTEIHEMGIDQSTLDVYRRLDGAGKLRVRVRVFVSGELASSLLARPAPPRRPDAMLEVVGVKLYADGALGSRGAALLQPYSDDAKNRGLTLTSDAELERAAAAATGHGWQIAVHAIGDRANRAVLDAFQRAHVQPADRFRIEHAQVIALDDIPRFARLGVIASMQPTHATSDMAWAEARVGKERLRGAYAWRRLLDAGATLSFGSDFPVEEPSLVAGLRAAVERGHWTMDQALTLDEALRAFSQGAAFASFEEAWRGRAAAGQAADLTVFSTGREHLLSSRVDLTVVGGKVAFERADAISSRPR